MPRWGMVIDLSRCIGCNACTIACKQENGTPPEVFFTRVLTREVGTFPKSNMNFLPVLCNHCSDPPCESICPTGATYIREDGIVLVEKRKCIGCRACYVACPYKNRFYISRKWNKKFGYFLDQASTFEEYKYKDHCPGTTMKCTLCSNRIDERLEPACVTTCLTDARVFGDLDDPSSEIADLIFKKGGTRLLEGLNTNPSVYYVGG